MWSGYPTQALANGLTERIDMPTGELSGSLATLWKVRHEQSELAAWIEQPKLDAEFHSTLVSETTNAPVRILTRQLITMAHEHAVNVYEIPGATANSIAQHDRFIEALAAGDVQLATRFGRDHQKTTSRFALDELIAK